MIFARRTLRLITSFMRLYFNHRLSLTNQNACIIKAFNIYQLFSKRLIRIKMKAFRWVTMKQRTLNNFTIVPPSWAKELPSSPRFTYPLRAMWHIRPQHFPANQLCRPLRFVPHSSASTQLFFLSLPSFSMLSWVCSAFVALPSSRLMQSCSRCFVLSSLMMWPMNFHLLLRTSSLRFSISAICRTSLFVIMSCLRILNIRLRHLLWKTSILFSSPLFIFHVSQPYSKTGFTSVLYSLILFVDRQVFFSLKSTPLALTTLSVWMSYVPPPSLEIVAPKEVPTFSTCIRLH